MLASNPARTLNQITPDLGIPQFRQNAARSRAAVQVKILALALALAISEVNLTGIGHDSG